jgi:hypothetical protein
VLVLAVALAAVALPSTSGAVVELGASQGVLPDYDSRPGVAPTDAQIAAATALADEVQWDKFGTPSSLMNPGGFLAKNVQAKDATSAARSWLEANKALYKLSSTDALEVATSGALAGTDKAYAVVFRQRVDGLSSADGAVSISLQKAGNGWHVVYASSTLTGEESLTNEVQLAPAEGLVEAANESGEDVSVADLDAQRVQEGWREFKAKGLKGDQAVRKVAFPTSKGGVRAAYEAILLTESAPGVDQQYRTIVDAENGNLLMRQSLTDNAVDNPTWDVFPAWPQTTSMNEYPWNYPSADVRDLWCWFPYPGCQLEVGVSQFGPNTASRVEWDKNAETNQPTFQTTGNNADAIERWISSGPGAEPRVYGLGRHAVSPTRDYRYPWTNAWFESKCNPAVLAGNGNDIEAAIANLFAMHNRMHDFSYHLGWTEQRWNAQHFNFGMGGAERDAVLGQAQASAISGGFPNYSGRDNANMNAGVEGQSPSTNMFLWQPLPGAFYAPCVDGDYDMSVIGHEYGHAIESRMIGKGARRQGTHAGMMGESFGDLVSSEYLNEANFVPYSGEKSPFVTGPYATGNHFRGIRNYDMSWPMGGYFPEPGKEPSQANPLNFGSLGYDVTGPQVHADGEIWSATNYDIRSLLLDRYPSHSTRANRECLRGERPADACPGNRRWIQLYFDAMVLMPVRPSMLDARNAILAADVARFGGANQDLLWQAFAERGFGQAATNTGSEDGNPIPDFSSPRHENATLVFNAVAKDEAGVPVPANIFVGDYEARATPIADTNPATAGPNLDNAVPIIPTMAYVHGDQANRHRAYNFVASAPGYGHVRFKVTGLKPGETRNITVEFPTNHASQSKGAVATGEGDDHSLLIDDTEGTNWDYSGAPVQGRQVVVKLSGPVSFTTVNVSAMTTGFPTQPRGPGTPTEPAENRFTALRAFDLYACTAGADAANATCDGANEAGWRRILKSEDDAFPGQNPRPTVTDMALRTWNVPSTTATHVRLVVRDNQCTGQESFQGDQDNDPGNNSDCRVGNAGAGLPPRHTEVHAAELQIQSSNPNVIGAVENK